MFPMWNDKSIIIFHGWLGLSVISKSSVDTQEDVAIYPVYQNTRFSIINLLQMKQ